MIPSVLSTQLIRGTKDFLTTTFPSTTPAFFDAMERFVNTEEKLYKGPYVSVALPFRKGNEAEPFFPDVVDENFKPYYHQELAFKRLGGEVPQATLVATGTGSGKTEAFMFPILDYCLKRKSERGIKAIIIYPMNALATDQAKRFAESISAKAGLDGIRVGLFIGDKEPHPKTVMTKEYVITCKDRLREEPPDILLTNYKMLDFLLMRPRDQKIWQHNIGSDVLRFIAVDEIHTFDGAQGTDLASLLRRLRAKLKLVSGRLACIGTSATLGTGSTEDIRHFASTVFSEIFDEDSVVTESRIGADEFFEDVENDFFNFPDAHHRKALNHESYTTIEAYIAAQYNLWFYEEPGDVMDEEFRRQLGMRLKELSLFKLLLHTLDGKVMDQNRLIEAVKRRINSGRVDKSYFVNLINSLLALTSWAKAERLGSYVPPFLHVRVQLWLRELNRMVGSLAELPEITFSQDISVNETQKYYPVIHCRDCHAMGWGGVKKEAEQELKDDLDLFYQSFFSHDHRTTFIFPCNGDTVLPFNAYECVVDPVSGYMSKLSGNVKGIRVFESHNVDANHKSHNDCPFCNNKNSLAILGSRAASLTSVLIGQSYASGYNDDKKLITFSDSVQDAAHRAGFFGARSYQFTLRSAIQQTLWAESDDVPLTQLANRMKAYWSDRLSSPEEYAATFIAPDMIWLHDYGDLQLKNKLPKKSDLINLIDSRLDWSLYAEYGYRSNVGRTLERSAASVAYVPDLDGVLEDMLARLHNDIEGLRHVTKAQLGKFIFGLVTHMRKQGAIFTRHLDTYLNTGGKITYFKNSNKSRYMTSFAYRARSPQFLTINGPFERISNRGKNSWCDQWLMDNFLSENTLILNYCLEIYRIVLESLKRSEIVKERYVNDQTVWGLSADKLLVTRDVETYQCSCCRDLLSVSGYAEKMAEGLICLRKGCHGHYGKFEKEVGYYGALYSYGNLQRIVAEEHTGLLERGTRERIETNFKRRLAGEAWKTNLLSATPTLEMGIDIGNLSSVMLCSVPPNGANYLQRIGRAGRKDGNSFNATIANGCDHDLYFYSDPDAMMQGNIDAPGVFIDASAILQRQFLAFCIDRWVSEQNVEEGDLPDKLSNILEVVDRKDEMRFPFTLINYIQVGSDELLAEFFSLYEGDLQDSTKAQLTLFAQGSLAEVINKNEPDELKESMSLAYKILNKLEQVLNEKKALEGHIKALRTKLKELKNSNAKDKNYEDVLNNLEAELSGMKSILKVIKKRDTFEFFTNEGLLPNYAFPESGVILKSVIYRQKKKQQDEKGAKYDSDTYEYERPGTNAISELAPNNNFYAEGRKVKIDQVDMNVSKVELWRFCDQCSHAELDTAEVATHCPRCESSMWSDSGQRRTLLRMRQVMANTHDRHSRLKDDSEQRNPTFFTKQLLISFEQNQVQDAYAIESEETPFGFEFIQKVDFREINFGKTSLVGEEVEIAGKRIPRQGFVICKFCGKVQEKGLQDPEFTPNHAFTCDCIDLKDESNFIESLYLYREFSSEAIRLLLPITTMAISDEKLHSLVAAFQMGLKSYFKGSVDHLRVSVYDEVEAAEEYKRRYLVLYDTVPGGTGYLRQLMRDMKPLFEVLEQALAKLNACGCNEDHTKDGCYQCIYAYKNNFQRPMISREKAKDILSEILAVQGSANKVTTVSEVPANGLFDSELEERFHVELGTQRNGQPLTKLKQIITTRHRTGFLLEIGDCSYEMEQQVEVGEADGVALSCRADFVFYPLRNSKLKPIVVFTDGFTYHRDRIGKDTAQRMALVLSQKYMVWSLTWEDVYQRSQKAPKYKYIDFLKKQVKLNVFKAFHDETEFLEKTSFDWLLELLQCGDLERWEKRAKSAAVAMLKPVKIVPESWDKMKRYITAEMVDYLNSDTDKDLGGQVEENHVTVMSLGHLAEINKKNIDNIAILIHMDDEEELSVSAWSGALRLYNLFQFLNCSFITSSSGLNKNTYDLLECGKTHNSPDLSEWSAVYAEVLVEAQPMVKLLAECEVDLPDVGYEICDSKGCIVADSELSWPDRKIAVMLDNIEIVPEWRIFSIDQVEELIKALKEDK